MAKNSVKLDRISIIRAFGINQTTSFSLENISPSVNIVFGPNGSGKTTTSLAIQELLWPGATKLYKPTINGSFVINKNIWSIVINAGHLDTNNNLTSNTIPNLGSSENQTRYLLPLHELISSDNKSFAKTIAEESQGGYDLEAARENLQFGVIKRTKREIENIKNANKRIKEIENRQKQIISKEKELPQKIKSHEIAVNALQEKSLLEKVKNIDASKDIYIKLKTKFDLFPEKIKLLNGNEREILNNLRAELNTAKKELTKAETELQNAEIIVKNLKLPKELFSSNFIPTLQGFSKDLFDIEQAIDSKEALVNASNLQQKIAEKRLGGQLTVQQLTAVNTIENAELSKLNLVYNDICAKEYVLKEQKQSLAYSKKHGQKKYNIEELKSGILLLKQWLKIPSLNKQTNNLTSTLFKVSLLIISLLSIFLAKAYSLIWLTLFLPAITLFLFSRTTKKNNSKEIYANDYKNTNLPLPEEWNSSAVIDLLNSLINHLELQIQENMNIKKLEIINKDEEHLNGLKKSFEEQKKLIEKNLGFELFINANWLPTLVQNISLWQQSNTTLITAKKELERKQNELVSIKTKISHALFKYGYKEINSSAHLSQITKEIDDRFSIYKTTNDTILRKQEEITKTKEKLVSTNEKIQHIFEKLQLDPENEHLIDEWIKQRPLFLELKKQLNESLAVIRNLKDSIGQEGQKFLLLDSYKIQELIKDASEKAEKRDAIHSEIVSIENEIKEALSGHDLEDALVTAKMAKDSLYATREQNFESIASTQLINWVQEIAIDKARPQVFKRAKILVAQFTNNHLELLIHDKSQQFLASVNGEAARSVDQLSVGERVQLLMAVRMAFLEQNEPAIIPLLLDETLGTSDDTRANLIIDAVMEIAKNGRQIFYFTAQYDEVMKWETRLKSNAIKFKTFNLSKIRKLQAQEKFPINYQLTAQPAVPAPEGKTRKQYANLLAVPNFNPRDENTNKLHLWHLINDNNLLYEFLKNSIETWGQFKLLTSSGNQQLINISKEQIDSIKAIASVIENSNAAWRIGRGKTINRRILQTIPNIITKTFIDDIVSLAKTVNGDAKKIIEALEARQVKNWREIKTEELTEYFERNGYISLQPTLTKDEIYIRTLSDVQNKIVNSTTIKQIVNSLPD